jgi:hypothetical protein
LAAAKPPYLTVPANLGHIKVKFVGQSALKLQNLKSFGLSAVRWPKAQAG